LEEQRSVGHGHQASRSTASDVRAEHHAVRALRQRGAIINRARGLLDGEALTGQHWLTHEEADGLDQNSVATNDGARRSEDHIFRHDVLHPDRGLIAVT
jgi:hypothetical protein